MHRLNTPGLNLGIVTMDPLLLKPTIAETIPQSFIRLCLEGIPQAISLEKTLSAPLVPRLKFNQGLLLHLISNKFKGKAAKEQIQVKVDIDRQGPNTLASSNRHNPQVSA
jgi:hypothetical protein